jgi:hypothetical protein
MAPKRASLLGLPAELRNNIYEQVVITKCCLDGIKEPALLAVSRQIRAEAFSIFYGGSTFTLPHDVLKWVLPDLSEQQLSAINQLELYASSERHPRPSAQSYLKEIERVIAHCIDEHEQRGLRREDLFIRLCLACDCDFGVPATELDRVQIEVRENRFYFTLTDPVANEEMDAVDTEDDYDAGFTADSMLEDFLI